MKNLSSARMKSYPRPLIDDPFYSTMIDRAKDFVRNMGKRCIDAEKEAAILQAQFSGGFINLKQGEKLHSFKTKSKQYSCGCNALDFNDNGICKYCGGV